MYDNDIHEAHFVANEIRIYENFGDDCVEYLTMFENGWG
jgi:hypothetical protein